MTEKKDKSAPDSKPKAGAKRRPKPDTPASEPVVKTARGKAKQASAQSASEMPRLPSESVALLASELEVDIPVTIPEGVRSPVDDIVEVLRREVIGQDRAVQAVTRALLKSREGFRIPGRPISVMFFAGPTGVGKTEMVSALAKALHGSWREALKIDCSEYSEPHAIARLLGAPPGYIGSDLPAVFARENIEGQKNRLILFDEIEKAHPRLHYLLLQIMDEGRVTLARRTKDDDGIVSFEECIIIMTSNVGAEEIDDILHAHRIGFRNAPHVDPEMTDQQIYLATKEATRKMFTPEFRNRITEFIVFRALERPSLYLILQKLLNISATRFANLGFSLTLTPEARDWLVDRGLDQELGVRPLVRAIERYIDTKIAELHAYGQIREGDILEARVADTGEFEFDGTARTEIVIYRAPRREEVADPAKLRQHTGPHTEITVPMRY